MWLLLIALLVLQQQIDKELDEMPKSGMMEPSSSSWVLPVLLVKKKGDSCRTSKNWNYKLTDLIFLSSLDMKSANWQVPMVEASKQYTVFTVSDAQ